MVRKDHDPIQSRRSAEETKRTGRSFKNETPDEVKDNKCIALMRKQVINFLTKIGDKGYNVLRWHADRSSIFLRKLVTRDIMYCAGMQTGHQFSYENW
ncbi:MAG TPA: hypothetical protein DCZ40_05835 [Lachnospiraceae bacterium]|nr:hypothetical protein [Lachnospiraceae bacterium]